MNPGNSSSSDLTAAEALQLLRNSDAMREGHFILSSGRRSAVYMQCAMAMADTSIGERLCGALAAKLRRRIEAMPEHERPTLCVSPAMGAVIVGYETAKQLGMRSIFMERPEGEFILRRGFEIQPGERCIMIEDVITTGKSSKECMASIEREGGRTVLTACLVDRTAGSVDLGAPMTALVEIDAPTYAEDKVPAELAAIPAIKPGSRRR